MKEEIKNTRILEKTVRLDKAKVLKRVQDDMVVQHDKSRFRRGFGTLAPEKVFSPFTFHFSQRRAFTLAEVLITLGIIGVVAAMTLPTLVHNYKKQQIETKLAKVYGVMNNAVLLSKAHDTYTVWSSPKQYDNDDTEKYLETTILPYLKTSKYCKSSNKTCKCSSYYNAPCVIFPDGSSLTFRNVGQLFAFYDLNQKDIASMKIGTSHFIFFLDNSNPSLGAFYPSGYVWGYRDDDAVDSNSASDFYLYNSDRETLKKYCGSKYTASNAGDNTCALLIMRDGWKIKDDYPIKF